jgi:eukaryotic-like serine/threonine-protein kinase
VFPRTKETLLADTGERCVRPVSPLFDSRIALGGANVASARFAPLPVRARADSVIAPDHEGALTSYIIERSLGAGHAGATFLARNSAGARVVVKVAHAGGGIFDYRMQTEVAAYSKLNGSAQLPRYLGFGVDEQGRPALVTEFVEGVPIASTLATRANPDKAVRIAMQILRAVRALNAQGLRHADLCPGNILIVDDHSSSVKVIDLGMAAPLTAPYEWGGALYYAPEQTAAKPSQGRANGDVYSVGALLLELITGTRPTPEALVRVPKYEVVADGRTVRLADVIARALEADPAHRYRTSAEMIEALRPFSAPCRRARRLPTSSTA